MPEAITTFARWLHLTSVVTLIGGILYARFVMFPASSALAPDARAGLDNRAAKGFRPLVFTAMTLLVVSGVYNFLYKNPRTPLYHALFGIKILLVLHVFAVAILACSPNNPRRARQMFGAAISGIVIILISAYLKGIA
jgi:uncharacterized membrane protein